MKKHFATGLVILLPVVLTILIVVFLVDLLTGPFVGLVEHALSSSGWGQLFETIPGASRIIHYGAQIVILVAIFFSTVLLGMIGRWFFVRYLIQISDRLLHRIPIVNKVYRTSQEIIRTLFHSRAQSFKQVVMVPFPYPGIYSVGFISSDGPSRCKSAVKADLLSVFVPTTPNPTSGFLMLVPREKVIFIDMRVEDAVKYVISCGVIHEASGPIQASDKPVMESPLPAEQAQGYEPKQTS
jgi:uncharacterized membrane protein